MRGPRRQVAALTIVFLVGLSAITSPAGLRLFGSTRDSFVNGLTYMQGYRSNHYDPLEIDDIFTMSAESVLPIPVIAEPPADTDFPGDGTSASRRRASLVNSDGQPAPVSENPVLASAGEETTLRKDAPRLVRSAQGTYSDGELKWKSKSKSKSKTSKKKASKAGVSLFSLRSVNVGRHSR